MKFASICRENKKKDVNLQEKNKFEEMGFLAPLWKFFSGYFKTDEEKRKRGYSGGLNSSLKVTVPSPTLAFPLHFYFSYETYAIEL